VPSIEKNPLLFLLSEEKHEKIFQNKILPEIFSDVQSRPNPVVIIFGGQPGSGKSAAVDAAIKGIPSKIPP